MESPARLSRILYIFKKKNKEWVIIGDICIFAHGLFNFLWIYLDLYGYFTGIIHNYTPVYKEIKDSIGYCTNFKFKEHLLGFNFY